MRDSGIRRFISCTFSHRADEGERGEEGTEREHAPRTRRIHGEEALWQGATSRYRDALPRKSERLGTVESRQVNTLNVLNYRTFSCKTRHEHPQLRPWHSLQAVGTLR